MGSPIQAERRSGVERREVPRRADDWRKKIANTIQVCGLAAIVYTGLGWIFGPVLGKRVVGPSVAVDSVQSADIAQLRNDMSGVDQKLSDVLDIACQIATTGQFKGGITPRACKEAK